MSTENYSEKIMKKAAVLYKHVLCQTLSGSRNPFFLNKLDSSVELVVINLNFMRS